MSFIKQLMEINMEREDEIDDLIDQAKEHENYETAIQQINMRKNHLAMRRILSALVDDERLVVDALARFQDKSKMNESFTPAEIKTIWGATGLKGKEIPDDLMDKIMNWVWDKHPGWMPYGTAKARTGDPHNWIYDNIDEIVSAMKEEDGGAMNEGRMPAGVIKMKTKLTDLASEDPAALVARFEELAQRADNKKKGLSAKDLALASQWRHGFGKDNMSGPYIKAFK